MSEPGYPWWMPAAAAGGSRLVRALGATWRYTALDHPEFTAARQAGQKVIYCLWHSGLLPLAYWHRDERIAVLVSTHRDGELIARIIESLGFDTARGSSTRGGDAGVRQLLRHARRGMDLAVTPDGPRGPAEEVKDGVVYVAARVGLPVVPLVAAADRAWVGRSWDRFRVPLPFARVAVAHGAPIRVSLDAAVGEAAEAARRTIETAMHETSARARAHVGERV